MAKKQYELRYLPLFYEDLLQKIAYISEELHNPKAANDLKGYTGTLLLCRIV